MRPRLQRGTASRRRALGAIAGVDRAQQQRCGVRRRAGPAYVIALTTPPPLPAYRRRMRPLRLPPLAVDGVVAAVLTAVACEGTYHADKLQDPDRALDLLGYALVVAAGFGLALRRARPAAAL